MSSTIHRTPKSTGKQSLFFNDLASPATGRRTESGSKFTTPGQSAAGAALRRENFKTADLPPPPMFTLEDRSDYSPEFGITDYSIVSPEPISNPRNTTQTPLKIHSTPFNKSPELNSNASTSSYKVVENRSNRNQQLQSWWSPGGRSEGGGDEKGKGSCSGSGAPVGGVVHQQPWSLVTLPPPREVARPEIQRNSLPVGSLNEEEWLTVYGFSPADTTLVLREFEKCGVILKHVLGPRDANWVHILYQSRADAEKALSKNGMQINGALIIGVKPVDTMQRQALNDRPNNLGFMPLPPPTSARNLEPMAFKPTTRSYNLQNGNRDNTIAAPAKSVVSKIVDLMFGV